MRSKLIFLTEMMCWSRGCDWLEQKFTWVTSYRD